MMQSLTSLLAEHHLFWKPDSLCYMGSVSKQLDPMTLTDTLREHTVPNVDNMEVLGTQLEKSGSTKPSLQHRSAKAEKALWSDKDVLMSKCIPLSVRFRRYVERVVPRFLHGCGSWAWSQSLLQSIITWEGKALRRILGSRRHPDDDWLTWFRRCTRMARSLYIKSGFTPLAVLVLREIHRAASRLQPPDSDRFIAARGTVILLADAIEWKDTWWWHRQQAAGQVLDPLDAGGWRHAANFGNRGTTWDGVFVHAYGLEWNLAAKDADMWRASYNDFLKKAYGFAKSALPRYGKQSTLDIDERPRKKPRVLTDLVLPWNLYDEEIGAEVVGDNELVVNWVNGQAAATGHRRKSKIEQLSTCLGRAWRDGLIAPRVPSADWCRHVYRERNGAADALANEAMDE